MGCGWEALMSKRTACGNGHLAAVNGSLKSGDIILISLTPKPKIAWPSETNGHGMTTTVLLASGSYVNLIKRIMK